MPASLPAAGHRRQAGQRRTGRQEAASKPARDRSVATDRRPACLPWVCCRGWCSPGSSSSPRLVSLGPAAPPPLVLLLLLVGGPAAAAWCHGVVLMGAPPVRLSGRLPVPTLHHPLSPTLASQAPPHSRQRSHPPQVLMPTAYSLPVGLMPHGEAVCLTEAGWLAGLPACRPRPPPPAPPCWGDTTVSSSSSSSLAGASLQLLWLTRRFGAHFDPALITEVHHHHHERERERAGLAGRKQAGAAAEGGEGRIGGGWLQVLSVHGGDASAAEESLRALDPLAFQRALHQARQHHLRQLLLGWGTAGSSRPHVTGIIRS